MNVLLVYPSVLDPRVREDDARAMPIGLYYVAAALRRNGHDAEILNGADLTEEQIERALEVKKPHVVGLSVLNANRWGAVAVARRAKSRYPDVPVVFGGIGATCLWEHFLTYFPEVDFVVQGEGEKSFVSLVERLENGGPVDDIPGIAYRKDGRPFQTGDAERAKDLDTLDDPAQYFGFSHVSSSRGCFGRCTFCGAPNYWGGKIRYHSPAWFVEQLSRLRERGISFFFVSDDTFTANKRRVVEICRGIVEKNLDISWAAISRVDAVDEEVLFWMRRAGCIQISYGVESGSEKIRAVLGKNIRTEDIKRAFALTRRFGIMARAYFIYGCPGETWETIGETIDLIGEIEPLSAIFYILQLFPGNELYERYKRATGATDDIWLQPMEAVEYFRVDPRLDEEQILAFGEKLRSTYYKRLPSFADSLELEDDPRLFPAHADFLSRLGMTFLLGDYAGVEAMDGREETAEKLFGRALTYQPDHRAFLGLGILLQKKGNHAESVNVLKDGTARFPHSDHLAACLGVGLMNLGRYDEAVRAMSPFRDSEAVRPHLDGCRRALRK